MSVSQIPNLSPATSLNGSEQLEAVQSGSSVRLTVTQIGTYINAQYPAPGISSVTASSPLTATTISGAVNIALPAGNITNTYLASMANGTVKANLSGSTASPSDVTPSAILDTFGTTTGSMLYRGASDWQALTAGTNATILRSNGTTSAPSWSTLSPLIDAAVGGSSQGSILFRGSTQWQNLPPGSAGQILQTQGSGADPTWFTVAGAGTVTNVSTGTGLTGGPITTSGTISIANTGVTAGSYGSSSAVPSIAVNAQGQITSVSNTTINAVTLTTGTISSLPTNGTDIANKEYVDSVAQGLNFHAACNYGSTAALPSYTYSNGASGVGATITASANGALVLDGHTFVSPTDVGLRVLIKDETSGNAPYNGVYTVTATGSGGAPFVLTRATDYDTSGAGTNEIDAGDFILVLSGSTLANTSWVQQTPLPIVVGTTGIIFTQFGAPVLYSAGTGLSLVGTTFSIANTAVTANSYGSASSVGTFTVNAQGQLTAAASTSIAIDASQVTTGSFGVARGGTGITSYTIGDLVYASGATTLSTLADVATGNALISGGVGVAPSWGKINLTTHISGTLPVANGGTGQSAALTQYGVIYGLSATAMSNTAAGATGEVLVGNTGAAPSWAAISSTLVSSISFGSTGLTPATATTGAVTVAGTLVAANGGTGQSSYTIGDILYASGTTTLSKLADVAIGSVLVSGGVGAAPAYSATPTVTSLTATTITSPASTDLTIQSAGTIAITVDTSQRVGIGTTSPTSKLHVAGTGTAARITVESTGTAGANLPTFYFNRTSTTSSASDFQGSLVWSRTLTDSTAITSSIQSLGSNVAGSQAMNLTYNAYTSHQFQINSVNAMTISSSGKIAIGTGTSPTVSLAISATDAILLPVGTTGQQPTGAAGMLRFNSTTTSFEGYNGTAWGSIGGGATGGGTDQIFYLNGQTVNTSYSIPSGQNAGTFGPVTIAGGAVVTVPSGSTWSVV